MTNIDVTNRIERLEVFEERVGVTLDSLSAFVEDYGAGGICLRVCGEIQARNGTELLGDVDLVVAAYDSSGRIIGTEFKIYCVDKFFGLETFNLAVQIPLSQVSKVRVYPKKR